MENHTYCQPIVIGGAVMDLRGRPQDQLQLHTSNPGHLQQMPGGVGRNIAENLVRLGVAPFLISAVGSDLTGDALLQHTQSIGLTVEGLVQLAGYPTAVYLAILDATGDLHTAIADMAIFDQLTPERIQPFADQIKVASMVVIDTNLPVESIHWICHFCDQHQIPLWVEPVSVEKSRKLRGLLPLITYISPNREELEALTGATLQTKDDLEDGIGLLVEQGIDHVLVTLGKDGILLGDRTGVYHFPAHTAQVVDVTGAGDSFVAGTVFGLSQGRSIGEAIGYGLATAKLTVETEDTVFDQLNHQLLEQHILKEE